MARKSLTLIAGIVSMLAGVAAGQSYDTTWNGSVSADWDNDSNWSAGKPASGEYVSIPDVANDPVINNANAIAGRIDLASGAKLTVTGRTLELDGGSTSTFTGEVLLTNSTSIIHVTTSNHTFAGTGKIDGQDDGSRINIEAGRTLTNTMGTTGFVGQMQINGLIGVGGIATFANQGRVQADGGTIQFGANTALSDTSGAARWQAASGGTLKFSREATSLNADFVVDGILVVDQNVKTCGQLTFNTGASIDVDGANSKTFKFLTFDGNSTCSNPADSGGGTNCSTDPYVVSSDHANCS